MWRIMVLLLGVLLAVNRLVAATPLQDPTQRPVKITMTQAAMQKKYPIDMVIVGGESKVLKIGYNSYTVGDALDGLRIVDIRMDKVILEDGRHGYITLLIER